MIPNRFTIAFCMSVKASLSGCTLDRGLYSGRSRSQRSDLGKSLRKGYSVLTVFSTRSPMDVAPEPVSIVLQHLAIDGITHRYPCSSGSSVSTHPVDLYGVLQRGPQLRTDRD